VIYLFVDEEAAYCREAILFQKRALTHPTREITITFPFGEKAASIKK
jgi:hypothetical protein